MLWFIGSLCLVLSLLLATTLLGRSIVLLLKIEDYSQASLSGLENFALASFIGTATLGLAAGWLSKLGLPMRTIAILISLIWLALVAIAFRQDKTALLLVEGQRLPGLLALSAAVLIGAAFVLLPLAVGNSYAFLNDTFIYISNSEFLQTHGFPYSLQVNALNQPILTQIARNQFTGLRMGAIDFLALVQGIYRGTQAVDIFPAVSAWAVSSLGLALYSLLRSNFRLPVNFSIFAVGVLGFNLNPIAAAAMFGFLPQTFGLVAFIWSILLASQVPRAREVHWQLALLLGLAFSFAITAYSAILPIMVAGIAIYWMLALLKSFHTVAFKPQLWTMLACLGFTLLLTNYELVRSLRAIPFELQMLNSKIGWNVPWSTVQFWEHAVGAIGGGGEYWVIQPPWSQIIAALGTALIVIGFVAYLRQRSDWLVLVLSILFVFGWVYYAQIAHNPWTGQVGQTWGLYKLNQYGYIIVFPMQMLGLYAVLGKAKFHQNRIYWALIILLGLPFLLWQYQFTHQKTSLIQAHFASSSPVDALRQMGRSVAARNPSQVILIAPEEDFWPKRMYAYFLYPMPTAISSKGTGVGVPPKGALCVLEYAIYGVPLEQVKNLQPLPANAALVDCAQPVISGIQNPNGFDRVDNKPFIWLGQGSTTIEIWSGRKCQAVLQMQTTPGPSIPDSGIRHLQTQVGDEKREFTLETNSLVTLDIPLEAGQTNLAVLTPLDEAQILRMPNGDTRPLVLGLTGLSVQCVER